MVIEYTKLSGGERYRIDFEYSAVSSTPVVTVRTYKDGYRHTDKGAVKTSKLTYRIGLRGEAAINCVRGHLKEAYAVTALHDVATEFDWKEA